MFSNGNNNIDNNNNNNNNNNNELNRNLNNLNSTTCSPEDKTNNESACSVDNINSTKENLLTEKNPSVPGTRQSFKRVIVLGESMLNSVNDWEMSRKVTVSSVLNLFPEQKLKIRTIT